MLPRFFDIRTGKTALFKLIKPVDKKKKMAVSVSLPITVEVSELKEEKKEDKVVETVSKKKVTKKRKTRRKKSTK